MTTNWQLLAEIIHMIPEQDTVNFFPSRQILHNKIVVTAQSDFAGNGESMRTSCCYGFSVV